MKNITLALEDSLLKKAEEFARRRRTTISALVREHLASLIEQDGRIEEARLALLELIDKSTARMGPNYKWDRQELYARSSSSRDPSGQQSG